MSDALTNREIEDVLTSIRRLVGQEGRTVDASASQPGLTARPSHTRLVLTPAQRIDAPDEVVADNQTAAPPKPAISPTIAPATPTPAPAPDTPPRAAPDVSALPPAPDFRRLEATIAELEAAVSASGSVFEPDEGDATAGQTSNVTALYAKPSFIHNPVADDRAAPVTAPTPRADAALPPPEVEVADDDDEDDDALFETVIDEATLRALVAQIVREELHGQLGERITHQVRKLVRSEVARALDERKLL
ncbi:MAG: hypothetical protein JJU15_00660 [Pararhodobacter sp.]|nr:hypothetical protein [Pararhodobacter sp.]